MKTVFLLATLFYLSLSPLQAQWLALSFGDSLIGEKGIASHVMPDGSLWMLGSAAGNVALVKIDTAGTISNLGQWYGSAATEYPNNMVVQNGQLIIAGEVHQATGVDALIIIVDTAGNQISRTQYGLPNQSEQYYDIKATRDGGFIVTGFLAAPNGNSNDILVSKFDALYLQEWSKSYDYGLNEVGVAVVERPNGGYLIAADQAQPSSGNYNVQIVAIDGRGTEEWNTTISNPNNGGCKQMKLYQDQILIVGEMSTSSSMAFDPYLVRLNLAGQIQWEGTLPKSNRGDALFDLAIQNNNRYYLTGYSYNTATANTDMILLVVDSLGQTVEERYYGGNSFDMAYDIQLLPGAEVVLTGFKSEPSGNQFFVVRERFPNLVATTTLPAPLPLALAPNPTTATLQLLALPQGKTYTATLYDPLGRLVWQGNLPANHELNLAPFSAGIYYLQLADGEVIWGATVQKN